MWDLKKTVILHFTMDTKQSLEKEIKDIHHFFQSWYNGKLKKTDFHTFLDKRLSEHFSIIFPSARQQSKSDFLDMVFKDYADDESFKIEIHNVVIRPVSDAIFLANYEEWQYTDDAPIPQLKIKTTAMIKALSETFEWLAIHETKIP